MQGQEHQPDHPRSPPAVIALLSLRAVFELAGEEWPPLLELAEDVAAERAVRRQELVHPALALRAPRAAEAPDPCPDQRQVLDRINERVPLEERALLPQQPVELRAVVLRPKPAEEHEVLRPLDRRDDVDLEKAEPAHRVEDVRGAAIEQLRPHGDPPGFLRADRSLKHRA